MAKTPLPFDPIQEAAAHWTAAGWDEASTGMAFVTSIMRVQQILQRRVDTALEPFDLTFARFEVLMLLSFTKRGELPLGKIGQRLQVHPASVTNAIDRLEQAGLVRRAAHPHDGRTRLAQLTAEGRRTASRAAKALNTAVFNDPGITPVSASQVVSRLAELRREAGDFTADRAR